MNYETELAEWKAKHGITTPANDAPDPEEMMAVEDSKRPGKDYCAHCGAQFAIADMRLITRSDDPYMQFDDSDDPHGNKPDYWIAVKHRVRACKPCFKEHYENED